MKRPRASDYFVAFFFFGFLTPAPPGFSLRKPAPPGFSLRKPAPPGFSLRWAIFIRSDVVVEPAASAGSDKTTRPAPARSTLRMSDFMIETSLVESFLRLIRYSSENPPVQ